jgi:hypothetical protein
MRNVNKILLEWGDVFVIDMNNKGWILLNMSILIQRNCVKILYGLQNTQKMVFSVEYVRCNKYTKDITVL